MFGGITDSFEAEDSLAMHADKNNPGDHDEFARAGAEGRTGLVAEFFDFLRHNKKWWLLPILLAFLAIGALILLGGTGAAPFIYPLF